MIVSTVLFYRNLLIDSTTLISRNLNPNPRKQSRPSRKPMKRSVWNMNISIPDA